MALRLPHPHNAPTMAPVAAATGSNTEPAWRWFRSPPFLRRGTIPRFSSARFLTPTGTPTSPANGRYGSPPQGLTPPAAQEAADLLAAIELVNDPPIGAPA